MSTESGKMPSPRDTVGIKRWHNERGIPWGPAYDGPGPMVVRRMVPVGSQGLGNLSVHLSNEHGINSDKAPRGSEVEHMHAHTYGLFRHGQEHYHGEVPEPEQAKPVSISLEWHEGEHGWDTHDGYPRHQHSLNGNLTISPRSTGLHFKGSTFEDEAQL